MFKKLPIDRNVLVIIRPEKNTILIACPNYDNAQRVAKQLLGKEYKPEKKYVLAIDLEKRVYPLEAELISQSALEKPQYDYFYDGEWLNTLDYFDSELNSAGIRHKASLRQLKKFEKVINKDKIKMDIKENID